MTNPCLRGLLSYRELNPPVPLLLSIIAASLGIKLPSMSKKSSSSEKQPTTDENHEPGKDLMLSGAPLMHISKEAFNEYLQILDAPSIY